jgi:hypothetical protein
MGAPLPRDLQKAPDPAVAQHLDPIERKRRARKGADETLAAEIVVVLDADGTRNVEPIARPREAPLARARSPAFEGA